MVILKNSKRLLIIIMAVLLAVSPLAFCRPKDTSGISRACQNSPACLEALEREKAANASAASAASSANLYQAKVNELSASIAAKEVEIASTEAEIIELNAKITEAEEKLAEQQEALASMLVNRHFESDSEPIKILAGSSSISDLAEKQARETVVKEQISSTAISIKNTKIQLENDKASVEQLLEQQKQAKIDLVATRSEQQAIVDRYENDAAAYAAAAKEAQAAQRAAEQAEQEAHPELYRGSSYTGDNTYPWQNDCPSRQDDFLTYWEDAYGWHKIGGYVCECVSYVGWKAYEYYGLALGWGNAYSWDDAARNLGYLVNHTPAANSIGQSDGGTWGHVFWVESINADGSANVTEYNNAYATQLYSGSYHYGDFGSRTIPAGDLWQYNFIHFE